MMGEVNFVWILEKVTVFQSTAGLHRLKNIKKSVSFNIFILTPLINMK